MDCGQTLQNFEALVQAYITNDRVVEERKLAEFVSNTDLSKCLNAGVRLTLNSNASNGTIQYSFLG
jgi:hypothetical protein